MSFRKEKKFKISRSDLKFLKFSLLKKGMEVLYPSRKINSCYFDTNNLKMYHDSEEGVLPRKKIRLRWYENQKQINKEIKISSTEGRFKTIQSMNNGTIKNMVAHKLYDSQYGVLFPKILIKYSREYFEFKNLRLTFDTEIKYININSLNKIFYSDKENVVEIKTPIDISEDYLEKIIGIQPTRFSKYCRGISSFFK
tara:strand:+ start:3175 stop:3765 length:591 start_codon:yes stop_codon:yes gene_type:complete